MKRFLDKIVAGVVVAIALPISLQAQTTQPKDTTVNRTVVVEQEYNPDIMDASKVNVLPKVEEPTVSKKEVEYATTFFPATTVPAGVMRPYTGKEIQPVTTPGYVRAGYGNYGNLDVLANYLFRLSKKDNLNVRFQMDGMDGKLTLPFTNDEKWNAYYYRTRANVDYTHQFNKLDLNLAGNFGLSNFNFKPESVNSKQKFTSGDFHAGVHFIDETAPLRFNAETNLLMYQRQHNMVNDNTNNTSITETIIRTKGDVTGAINDQQSVTIGVEMNNFLYSGYTKNLSNGDEYIKNYTTLLLNPSYELNSDDWKLHIGANVDLSFGFDKAFRVSPDVTAQYIFSDSYVLYAQATGGKLLNDFRRLESVCPYGELPEANRTDAAQTWGYVQRPYDTYEQINGSIGFKASPYTGIWFNIYGGYQNLKNDLSYSPFTGPGIQHFERYLNFSQDNTDNFYAGGEISYDYKDILSLSAKYTYRKWDSTVDYLLAIKPVNEMSFNLRIQPIAALNIHLGYDYVERKKVQGVKMNAVNDLHVGADYDLFKGISVYAQVNNLLNKKYQYYLGYPAEGFNFLGGLSFRF